MEQIILHSDLNAFYASVEQMLHPELKGHPVAVCGSMEDRHGIVLTKSQLAKEAGVRTGINGVKLWQFANGYDRSRVCEYGYEPPAKSVGHGITFTADLIDNTEVYHAFLELAQGVGKKLRATNAAAMAVTIYVRNNQLYWQQHQTRLVNPTQSWRDLAQTAYSLFCGKYNWQYPIRSLTITARQLLPADAPRQTDLFFDQEAFEKQEKLENTIFDIRRRFGKNAVTLAGLMDNKKIPGGRLDEQFVLPNAMYQ